MDIPEQLYESNLIRAVRTKRGAWRTNIRNNGMVVTKEDDIFDG